MASYSPRSMDPILLYIFSSQSEYRLVGVGVKFAREGAMVPERKLSLRVPSYITLEKIIHDEDLTMVHLTYASVRSQFASWPIMQASKTMFPYYGESLSITHPVCCTIVD